MRINLTLIMPLSPARREPCETAGILVDEQLRSRKTCATRATWLRAAAPVPAFIGFAVRRATFWDALVALRHNKTTGEKVVETIADRYVEWLSTFEHARARSQ